MLQQSFTQNNQSSTPSSLAPTTSPQPDAAQDMQGAAGQDLLQQEGQTIQVPSSGGTATRQQTTQADTGPSVVGAQPAFQPFEIVAIFVIASVLLVAAAVFAVKKARVPKSSAEEDEVSNAHPRHQEATDGLNARAISAKKPQKKKSRRQRRQQAKRP